MEHEDNANMMGEAAGRNMAGQALPYHYLPYFYSDLFEIGYEAIGETRPDHTIVIHWREPLRRGCIFYLHQDRVRGIVFWNQWNCLPAGRELLADPGPFDSARLKEWAQRLPDG